MPALLMNEADIKAYMRQILQLVWSLSYTTHRMEWHMASLIRHCRIHLTVEDEMLESAERARASYTSVAPFG